MSRLLALCRCPMCLAVDYLSAMPGNGDCEVDAQVVKVGRTIPVVNVTLKQKSTGMLTAQVSA